MALPAPTVYIVATAVSIRLTVVWCRSHLCLLALQISKQSVMLVLYL